MSYYRRRYYPKRTYVSPFSSPSNHDEVYHSRPRKDFNVTTYIKKEFLNADEPTFSKIAGLYRKLYGDGPYRYLLNTYYSWQKGYVRLSGQTMHRILECVPRFLTDEKRFYILKCEILFFVEELHYKQHRKNVSIWELNKVFEDYSTEIHNFNEVNLNWFVGKGIFTEAQIKAFLSVCRYALNKKLNLAYRQVYKDLTLIKAKISGVNSGTFKASYRVDFIKCNIGLSDIDSATLRQITLPETTMELEGNFKKFAEKYILDELMAVTFLEKVGITNSVVSSRDLDFFIDRYEELQDNEKEASLASIFKGEGGQLSLSVVVKSIKSIRISIFISIAKILFFVTIFVVAILLSFAHKSKLKDFGILIVIGGLILLGSMGGGIVEEIGKIKDLRLDLKRYAK